MGTGKRLVQGVDIVHVSTDELNAARFPLLGREFGRVAGDGANTPAGVSQEGVRNTASLIARDAGDDDGFGHRGRLRVVMVRDEF